MKKILQTAFLLMLITHWASAQDRTVTGTVKDKASGTAMPGVNVTIKGTTAGTITDANGTFSIAAGANAELIFSFIGFSTQSVKVGSLSNFEILMAEDVSQLEEVVVSGLATSVKRSNLANSVATISAKDLLGTTTPVTTDGALQGKIAVVLFLLGY